MRRVAPSDWRREPAPAPREWRGHDHGSAEVDAILDSAEADDVSGRAHTDERDARRDSGRVRRASPSGYRPGGHPYDSSAGPGGSWDGSRDGDWDADWETGTWDTDWANGGGDASASDSSWGREDDWDGSGAYDDDAWSRSLVALGAASMAEVPLGRLARVRMVLREQPVAGAMLVVFLLGFLLTCVAPLIPLLRLGYDTVDTARQVSALQQMVQSGPQELLQPAKLQQAQSDVHAIERDLYEINAAINVLGAPLAAVNPTARDYRLLVHIGYDLTAAADEGVQVAQTLLVPLQGGALSTSASNPGLTSSDIDQARGILADARSRVVDALAAYHQLNQRALPSQLRPGSHYGSLLALLPTAVSAFDEMDTLLSIAPGLLGIGQRAYYLVIAMDRAELRPGGGFQGNYGILTLAGGKQPADQPLSLHDTYNLDQEYYTNSLPTGTEQDYAKTQCAIESDPNATSSPPPLSPDFYGPEPPRYFWWWPFRDFSWCFNWGLRDSNLSADFPTNARMAMDIVQSTPGEVPSNGQLQGVIAFTPALIEDLLRVPGVGPIALSQFPKDPLVTADNLEQQIHCHQLPNPTNSCPAPSGTAQDRKYYTHLLSQTLLAKIRTLHGGGLQAVVHAALDALKSKDLEVYFAEPRAELILQQLGLGAQIHTGNGDGFFVVDANDGGNKANLYVTEHQQDLVTLLPDGGAVHRLEITITYNYPTKGWVYAVGGDTLEDYNGIQRVYMPGDATIVGSNGYVPLTASPSHPSSEPQVPADYADAEHLFNTPVTLSDVPGRTMVMGHFAVACADDANGQPLYGLLPFRYPSCNHQPHINSEVIDVEWYTPNAWSARAGGHGSYSELIEKQAGTESASGSTVGLTVYVDTSQLNGAAHAIDWTDPQLRATTIKGAVKVFDGPLNADTVVPYNF